MIIGDSGVGKSCLRHRISQNEFSYDHGVTVGAELETIKVKVEDKLVFL